jgi:hypothetical protein
VKERIHRRTYLRRCNDFCLFDDDPRRLEEARERIAEFLISFRLRLYPVETGSATPATRTHGL